MVFGLYQSPSSCEGLGPPKGGAVSLPSQGVFGPIQGVQFPESGNRLKVFLENPAKTE